MLMNTNAFCSANKIRSHAAQLQEFHLLKTNTDQDGLLRSLDPAAVKNSLGKVGKEINNTS